MLHEFFTFIHEKKITLFKLFSFISFVLVFLKPLYGFSMFFTSIGLLAYSGQLMEFFDR